jgi:20S proteasome subunit alpha 3
VLTTEGVVLATEKLEVSFLLEENTISEKIYCIDKHLYCVVSGLSADANFLIDLAREEAQKHRLKFREPMPIEQLIVYICDVKQYYTQAGSSRPFGAAFLFAGYDSQNKYQLYSTDPSGNYAGWKATAIGTNNIAANSFLKQEYKETLSLKEGLSIALRALVKTMETTDPSAKKIELVTIALNANGEVKGKTLVEEEIAQLITENKLKSDKK